MTSLWANTRLKRLNIFDHIAPFVELSVGIIDADYHLNNIKKSHLYTGYKAMTGIEISTNSTTTVSLGIGFSDMDGDVNFGSSNQ